MKKWGGKTEWKNGVNVFKKWGEKLVTIKFPDLGYQSCPPPYSFDVFDDIYWIMKLQTLK